MAHDRTVVLGVFSDTHCGSTIGLCPREGVHLDDGGSYLPSPAQRWLADGWEAGWAHVERVREREAKLASAGGDTSSADVDLGVLSNGDATDGNHHRTPQIFSNLEGYHIKAAVECQRIPMALGPKWWWVIRGTEAHVGKSGGLEEGMAVALEREGAPVQRDPNTGTRSCFYLPLEFHGKLLDFRHHGRMGQRAHTRPGYVRLYAHDLWAEYAMRGDRPPDLAVRSHFHTYEDSGPQHPTRKITRVVQMPAFQLATAFIFRIAAEGLADIGLVAIAIRPDGTLDVYPHVHSPTRGETWRP